MTRGGYGSPSALETAMAPLVAAADAGGLAALVASLPHSRRRTAAALLGFSASDAFWQLCLWAVPYGIGAGAVDAALNAYVALHYKSQHMSWLHCMWGIGASGGPMIMAACINGWSWGAGFLALGAVQAAIAVVLTLSLPLWRERRVLHHAEERHPARRSRRELLRMRGVLAVLVCFFCYNALETTCGTWAATYCVQARGIDAATAASWASLFYVGITLGRAVSGFVTMRVGDRDMIRLGQVLAAVGVVLVLLPAGNAALLPGLVLIGVGCAPIYPAVIHATPARFGEDVALELTGMQMAFAYIGPLALSPFFGVLAQYVGAWLYPFYLGILLVIMARVINMAPASPFVIFTNCMAYKNGTSHGVRISQER